MSIAGDFFAPPPSPRTKLGRHRQLAPTAGIHVSPICLGAMSIGDKWDQIMGTMGKESSFKLLDAFYDAGGNFIDTANGYQDETSENGWSCAGFVTKRLSRPRFACLCRTHCKTEAMPVLIIRIVHDQLQARAVGHWTAYQLCRQQHEIDAHIRRAVPQKAPRFLHRHPLRALGTHGHLGYLPSSNLL